MTIVSNFSKLLDEKSAATLLGFSIKALQSWRAQGRGPNFVKLSPRAVRYCEEDLVQWILSHKVETNAYKTNRSATEGGVK